VLAVKRTKWLVLAGALLFVSGHVVFWYMPRFRATTPGPGGAAALLDDPEWGVRLWIAYPHQNFAAARRQRPELADAIVAACRLAELPPPRLPAFGPFSLPPSRREMTVAASADGRRFAAAAQVYPGIARLARLAGRLTGNPWLAGGEVTADEAQATVEWQRDSWIYSSRSGEPEVDSGLREGARAGPRALAYLDLAARVGPLPPGRLALRSENGRLVVEDERRSAFPGAWQALGENLAREVAGVALLLLRCGDADRKCSALVLLSSSFEMTEEDTGRLRFPSAAVLYPRDGGRLRLPGEKLSALGLRLHTSQAAGLEVVAVDNESLSAAERIAVLLAPLLSGPSATFGLWLIGEEASAFARTVRQVLEAVPLVARREAAEWRDVETAIEPLAGQRLSVFSSGEGFRLVIEPVAITH
jgi:hypothetical protein